jgi:hypothetical protein
MEEGCSYFGRPSVFGGAPGRLAMGRGECAAPSPEQNDDLLFELPDWSGLTVEVRRRHEQWC